MRKWVAVVVLLVLACGATGATTAAAQEFPYDRELLLDARPMSGSKRLPGLEVAASGAATIDLWCNSGPGQLIIAGETVTVIPGPMGNQPCAPERLQADQDLLAALADVTGWRLDGEVLVLVGPRALRYRVMTN